MLQHFIMHSVSLQYLSSSCLWEVKNKSPESFKLLALKVVVVAYARWSLTRGSKYSDLTFGILEHWSLRRGGHLREVVITRGSTILAQYFPYT